MNPPAHDGSDAPPPAQQAALQTVTAATETVRAAQQALRDAKRELSDAIVAARTVGATINHIATAAGTAPTDIKNTLAARNSRSS